MVFHLSRPFVGRGQLAPGGHGMSFRRGIGGWIIVRARAPCLEKFLLKRWRRAVRDHFVKVLRDTLWSLWMRACHAGAVPVSKYTTAINAFAQGDGAAGWWGSVLLVPGAASIWFSNARASSASRVGVSTGRPPMAMAQWGTVFRVCRPGMVTDIPAPSRAEMVNAAWVVEYTCAMRVRPGTSCSGITASNIRYGGYGCGWPVPCGAGHRDRKGRAPCGRARGRS